MYFKKKFNFYILLIEIFFTQLSNENNLKVIYNILLKSNLTMIGGTTLSRELENDNKGSVTTKIMKYQSRANTLSNSMDGLTKLPAMSIQFATC